MLECKAKVQANTNQKRNKWWNKYKTKTSLYTNGWVNWPKKCYRRTKSQNKQYNDPSYDIDVQDIHFCSDRWCFVLVFWSIVVKWSNMPVKVVMFRQTLMRSRCSQEFDILGWIIFAEGQFVDFFFTSKYVSIALEQTFLDIIVNRQTDGLDLHP